MASGIEPRTFKLRATDVCLAAASLGLVIVFSKCADLFLRETSSFVNLSLEHLRRLDSVTILSLFKFWNDLRSILLRGWFLDVFNLRALQEDETLERMGCLFSKKHDQDAYDRRQSEVFPCTRVNVCSRHTRRFGT